MAPRPTRERKEILRILKELAVAPKRAARRRVLRDLGHVAQESGRSGQEAAGRAAGPARVGVGAARRRGRGVRRLPPPARDVAEGAAFGTPFWAYDPVRRTLCCGPYTKRERDERAAMSARFDEARRPCARAHAAAPPQLEKRVGRLHAREGPAGKSRRVAALSRWPCLWTSTCCVEASARDAGFLEVRDKSTPEEQARQEEKE